MVEPATEVMAGGPHEVKGTAADAFIEAIGRWGVDTVFGLPGDGINGLMEALRVHQDQVRFVQVRHEEAAAFMACAYAKYTGKLGCCIATSGPGAIHLLNGLYDAKMDGQPVLAITGMTYHDMIGTFYQQDVNTERLFEDVAVYDERVMSGSQAAQLADLACRAALSRRGVAHVTFPNDLQEVDAGAARSKANIPQHSSSAYTPARPLPTRDELDRMAAILNAGTKVAILAGRGALGARDELEQVAETLGAPIVKPLLGKACVPDESLYTTGGLGLLGTAPSEEVMEGCDTLLIVGSSYPYIDYLPKPGQARGAQIDLDPERLGLRYPVEIGVVGDAQSTLQALLPLLRRQEDRSFLRQAQDGMRDWWALLEDRGTRTDTPMHPAVVAYELDKLLDDDAIISTDSGTNTTWAARYVRIRGDQLFSCSGNLATMAPGFPYTIAAQIAYPGRQCVALVGDGCVGRLGYPFVPGTVLTRRAAAVHSRRAPPARADPQRHLHPRRSLPMLTRLVRRCARLGRSLARALQQRLLTATKPTGPAVAAGALTDLVRSRPSLVAENALLRQQLLILRRSVKRPRCTPADRALLVLLASRVHAWRHALVIVQPETVLRWHRQLFCWAWRWRSRGKGARSPKVAAETIALIRAMAAANRLWGAERIRGELLKLGIRVAKTTVQRHMRGARPPRRVGQTWGTFLRNHAHESWACDFLPVADLLFQPLYAFVVVALGSRRVVHVGVTRHPTDAWVAQQLREATPCEQRPRYLIRDNDSKYGPTFARVAAATGITELRTAYRAPRQNATCERFLGSVRRECLDHVLILGERHLRRVLLEYADYFNRVRPHQSLHQRAPDALAGGPPQRVRFAPVHAIPILGGLHHDYQRVA